MATELIDISLPVSPASVVWPSASKPQITRRKSMDRGDQVNDSDLFMNVHTGTHIDAPIHHLKDAPAMEAVPLEPMIGEAWVIDVSAAKDLDRHTLERAWPAGPVKRVLFKTKNSELWQKGVSEFVTDFTALTEDTGDWLIAKNVELVGIDYLSIQRYQDPTTVHKVLLSAGVVILEGLDLSRAMPGRYELICLPLHLIGSDGAPARAVLRPIR